MFLSSQPQVPPASPQRAAQPLFQVAQLRDFAAHAREFLFEQLPNVLAGRHSIPLQQQQFANLFQRKAKFLSILDQFERLDLAFTEQTESTFGPGWTLQEPLLFIEPDGVDAQTGFSRHLADSRRHSCFHAQSTTWSSLQSQEPLIIRAKAGTGLLHPRSDNK